MICTQEKGHEGLCTAGEVSGGCKKTAEKWFAPEVAAEIVTEIPVEDEVNVDAEAQGEDAQAFVAQNHERLILGGASGIAGISPEELAGSSEQQLAMLYRRHVHPSTRREAVEWAQNQVAARDLGAGA